MDYIVVEGVPPYDGRYEWDLESRPLNTHEWGWIKRLAGYLPPDLEGQVPGDPELVIVFAAIALRRAGKIEAKDVPQTFRSLGDAPFGERITLETDTEEADADPPTLPSSGSNGADSGHSSTASSETSAKTPLPSGTPGSATSTSARLTSAT